MNVSHAPTCGKIPRHARASVHLAGESWTRFLEIWDALADPNGDQTVEDFGPFYARFRQLQRLGVPFDECFVRRVEAVAAKCIGMDDDPDRDDSEYWETDAESGCEDELCVVPFCELTPGHLFADPTAAVSRRSPRYRYRPGTGEEIGPGPAIGANLQQHAPELAKQTDRMALPKWIEPADRVRSKGGKRWAFHGIPGTHERQRRIKP